MFLDTHAVVFLHAGETEQFGPTASHFLDSEELLIGPVVLLELQYLREIGRIAFDGRRIVDDLRQDIGLKVQDRRWLEVCMKATELSWTRDPFDRLIAAQALVEGQRLLTKDRAIRENCGLAFWD